ncbi:TPA: hypothetical protein N0F65_001486 [Lagenidium giganteum]|uniref:CAMK/CAMKL protein kinase n=1 Tax=Lagenidium giganteum TaxID=4803 RepID=A0AAV2Z1K3_9STRA|nr:TPA: hypothetical protein N0F65_001486 [Lagenidium giganteum]
MGDFGDIDDFNDHAVQGKPIKAYRNGHFENPKVLFVQHHWTWDEFLCAASQRLEMVPMASRVFNADGAEIDDIMCIEENDMLFFSTGRPFKAPNSKEDDKVDEKASGIAQVVGGYKVSTLLGRGGFGEVRLGIHQLTNDKVALKFILKSEMGSLGDVERTTTEIQCLTALNHPSIIKLLRVINEPNHVVLVFELLEGGDLFHYLKNVGLGGLSEEEQCGLFTQILAGVGYAHNQHICHRDLKLENILLSSKNDISSVKIADFGLSDFYKPGAMMKTSCGSISYLAPEVFRGTSNAGPPLDVWSLGVILFAIVCGRLPFEGSDLHGTNRPRENVIRNRIMRCQYKLDDNVSPALADLVTQMPKPDPNERATIPEIFGHPWVRGNASGILPTDLLSLPLRERSGEDEDDESFSAITFNSVKTELPGSPAFLQVDGEDKLPSIVRSPGRHETFPVNNSAIPIPAGSVAVAPLGTPGSGRQRPPRITENILQPKLSSARLDKGSPRPVPTTSGTGATKPTGSSMSPVNASFKRNPSSNAGRGRQRPGVMEKEKSHAERAPAHAGEVDKLPMAHQKANSRRRSTDLDDHADVNGHKAVGIGHDPIVKKGSGGSDRLHHGGDGGYAGE